MPNCPVCGSAVPQNQRFCPACHADLGAMYQQNPMYQTSGQNPVYQTSGQNPVYQTSGQNPVYDQSAYQPRHTAQNQLEQCPFCGRPVMPGQVCACQQQAYPQQQKPARRMPDLSQASGFLDSLLVRSGLKSRNPVKLDTFENGKRIVPDIMPPAEGEVPVKQYDLATLRSRFMAFTVAKAEARLQVTSRRVILRMPGRTPNGRCLAQQEFEIDKVAGLHASKDNCIHWGDLLSLIIYALLIALVMDLPMVMGQGAAWVLPLLVGIGALAVFFLLNKHWMLKSLLLLAVTICFASESFSPRTGLNGGLLLLALLFAIPAFIATLRFVVRPELQLELLIERGEPVILLRRGRLRGGCGFSEVMPGDQTGQTIREITSVIADVRDFGGNAAEKWCR